MSAAGAISASSSMASTIVSVGGSVAAGSDQREYDYVRQVKPKHQCPMCLKPYVDPRVTQCGHTFCLRCLKNMVDPRRCPVCHSRVAPESIPSLPPNAYVEERMQQLEVYCDHRKDGCQWHGPRAALLTHRIGECQHEGSACPFGCGMHVLSGWSKAHRDVCSLAPVTCACGKRLLRKDVAEHLATACEMAQPVCEFCGVEFPNRSSIADHVGECQFTMVSCKYAAAGCLNSGVRTVMKVHELTCAFAVFDEIRQSVSDLSVRMTELNGESQALEKQHLERSGTLSELLKLFETQKAQIAHIKAKQSSLEEAQSDRGDLLARLLRKLELLGVNLDELGAPSATAATAPSATAATATALQNSATVAIPVSRRPGTVSHPDLKLSAAERGVSRTSVPGDLQLHKPGAPERPTAVFLTCRNCRSSYVSAANTAQACTYHPGKRLLTVLAGTNKEVKLWSCCGSNVKSRTVGGCKTGEHVPIPH
jgi:hypothetical protein